ncbi:MAG: hypothetical protein A3H98_12335 [Bacteroidetes bacterium RIFCSPLOWO2_02_FULL_36_8]|nr:MAG: hypothetical protein A3H98_12335 [Bacteroidetes bacterium RIFCSPLOWO2_02_FULL_36_8]OFY71083.1 MAG: hypothetical protein A3G23_14830 [Bacteroidetes bacterium RIFCSPLOWO2_12_FULL_37_12]
MKQIVVNLLILLSFQTLFGQIINNEKDSKPKDDEIFIIVEKLPEFPGGMDSLSSFIRNNLEYPETAKKDSIEGRVIITYVIDTNGRITNPIVAKGVREDLDQAALELVKKIPAWSPGVQKGKNVAVKQALPIRFRLK